MAPNECPKCGKPYSRLRRKRINGRIYVYARHYLGYSKVDGRIVKRYRDCYLGPENGYIYVSGNHLREGLEFKGMHESGRTLDYLKKLLHSLEDSLARAEEAAEIAGLFEDMSRRLRGKVADTVG